MLTHPTIDNPLLRNVLTNEDSKFGGPTKLLAKKRVDALKRSYQEAEPSESASKWIQVGPTSIIDGQTYSDNKTRVLVTGRLTAVVPHPYNPDIIYVGAAQGGIWKTADGGRNWKPTSDDQPSLAIGALVIDQSNPLILYAGTGEGNFSGDSQYGCGILKTTDGGETWQNKAFDTFFTSRFCRLAINHETPTTIFAATVASEDRDVASGLYRSIDGGENWSRMENGLPPINTDGATDIVLDPTNADIAYAAFFGMGIYKTIDANADNPKWEQLSGGLPTEDMRRIVLGIPKSSPNTVYALMSNDGRIIDKFYCSEDGGSTWKPIGLPGNNIGGQGTYNINLAVHPQNKNVVYLSGISLWKAVRNSSNNTWVFSDIGKEIHPDNHAFAFNPQDPRVIYAGNDGGIYQSNDEGATWVDSINEGLCITQFNYMENHPTSDGVIIAGTQDNGTLIYRNSPAFYKSGDGDGGFCAIDNSYPEIYYRTYVGPVIFVSGQAGDFNSWIPIYFFLPPFENKDRSRNFLFYSPFALDKTNSNNIAIGGKNMLYLDDSQGLEGWQTRVPLPGENEFVSSINYVNSNLIYLATIKGSVFRLIKSGNDWQVQAINSESLPRRWIWDIVTLPNDNSKVIVILSGFGTPHVFYGDVPQQGVAEWKNISGNEDNGVPDIPVNAIVVDDDNPDIIYIGTDSGVWHTIDRGKNWKPFNAGLPRVQVYDMRLHKATHTLQVATHGRGIWERRLDMVKMDDVNILVRDNIMDTGRLMPSQTSMIAAFDDPFQGISLGQELNSFMCADIKIDSPDSSYSYQMDIGSVDYTKFEYKLYNRNVRRGKINHVYVQINNRGVRDVNKATIKLLYCNIADGYPKLPDDFWIQFPNNSKDITHWKPIGDIQVLPSYPKTLTYTEPTILSWKWNVPLDISNYIGLLVVIDSADDPIPPETKKILNIEEIVPKEKRVGLRLLKVND
jgi:photosystem II stability/assembly factor-like uncharacterized protein